jgi:very-short-patch-repair endonuclease
VKLLKDFDLATIAKYIDWGPFFIGWEMPGRFPDVLSDKTYGTEATRLYNDAQKLVEKIVAEKWFTADGVIGFWPAVSNNRDTITLQTDKGEVNVESLRQQNKKAAGQPSYSLADFVKPGPSPTTSLQAKEGAKASASGGWEGEQEPGSLVEEETVGYLFADPSVYSLLKEYAKKHRSQPTQAEEAMWELLKAKQLEGFKFRRQHIIDKFIADFVCLKRRLVIEIDGLIHNSPHHQISDEQRTERLNEIGFKLIRFTNEQVLNNKDATIQSILTALKSQPEINDISNLSSPTGGQGAGAIFLHRFHKCFCMINRHIWCNTMA